MNYDSLLSELMLRLTDWPSVRPYDYMLNSSFTESVKSFISNTFVPYVALLPESQQKSMQELWDSILSSPIFLSRLTLLSHSSSGWACALIVHANSSYFPFLNLPSPLACVDGSGHENTAENRLMLSQYPLFAVAGLSIAFAETFETNVFIPPIPFHIHGGYFPRWESH